MMLQVNLGQRSYEIAIATNDWAGLGPFARQRAVGPTALVVTDEHVARHGEAAAESLTAAAFRPSLVVLPPGEEKKSLAPASELYDRLAALNADRKTLLVTGARGCNR